MLTQRPPNTLLIRWGRRGGSAGLAVQYPVSWLTWSCSLSLSPGCSLVGSRSSGRRQAETTGPRQKAPKLVPASGPSGGPLCFADSWVLLPCTLCPRGPLPYPSLQAPPPLPACPPHPACFLPCLADLFSAILGRRPGPVSRAIWRTRLGRRSQALFPPPTPTPNQPPTLSLVPAGLPGWVEWVRGQAQNKDQ